MQDALVTLGLLGMFIALLAAMWAGKKAKRPYQQPRRCRVCNATTPICYRCRTEPDGPYAQRAWGE